MPRYSLKNLLLEVDTFVAAPDAGDPYVYRRKDDGWYTRHKDWLPSRPWALLDPKKPNFAQAIEKLNKAYPQYAFDISKISPKPQETQKSATAAPKPPESGPFRTFKSKTIPGNVLSTKMVQALAAIAEEKQPMIDEESSTTTNSVRAMLAVQYILDIRQDPAWTDAFEDAVKKFQDRRPTLAYKGELTTRATSFGDDDTYGKVDAETAGELISKSPTASRLLGRVMTVSKPAMQVISPEAVAEVPGLVILPAIKEKALKAAEKITPGTRVGKLTFNLDEIRAGNDTKVALCTTSQCAAYVGEVFTDTVVGQRADYGHAWLQHSMDAMQEGRIKFSAFMGLDKDKVAKVTKAYKLSNMPGGAANRQISEIVKTLVPDQGQIQGQLQIGDIVGLYRPQSTHFKEAVHEAGIGRFYNPKTGESSSEAFQQGIDWQPDELLVKGTGFGMNTHLGLVGATLDGIPIVFHNVGGEVFAMPVTQKTPLPVVWAKSPEVRPI